MQNQNVITLSTRRSKKEMNNFSTEQTLKLMLLDRLMGNHYVKKAMDEGISVDTLFTITTEVMASKKSLFLLNS